MVSNSPPVHPTRIAVADEWHLPAQLNVSVLGQPKHQGTRLRNNHPEGPPRSHAFVYCCRTWVILAPGVRAFRLAHVQWSSLPCRRATKLTPIRLLRISDVDR